MILFSSLLTSLLCAVLAQYLTRPILRLRDAAHAIARGNLEARAGLSGSTRRDEIADLVRDFDTMAGEIHDLVESNKRMLMGASHDLRSPISRIRVASSLASTAPEAERNELLDRIEFELLRLNGMIEQILTVARLESGQLKSALDRSRSTRSSEKPSRTHALKPVSPTSRSSMTTDGRRLR